MRFLPARDANSHKGQNGKVLVIGGSEDYAGAPYLTAMAASRTGVDIVTVAAPEKVAWTINCLSPDLITKKFEGRFFNWDNVKEIIRLTEDYDVVVIGNGLGLEPSTQDFVKEVVERCATPMIIDADAIKALYGAEIDNAIITPHEKEFTIMTRELLPHELGAKAKTLQLYAKRRIVYLLKGHVDIIASRKDIAYNKTGNPGMTVGGTGDVLAGLCGGLLAQTKDLFGSAYHAARINGLIGDKLLKEKGYGFLASDFLDKIPIFLKRLRHH